MSNGKIIELIAGNNAELKAATEKAMAFAVVYIEQELAAVTAQIDVLKERLGRLEQAEGSPH